MNSDYWIVLQASGLWLVNESGHEARFNVVAGRAVTAESPEAARSSAEHAFLEELKERFGASRTEGLDVTAVDVELVEGGLEPDCDTGLVFQERPDQPAS